MLLHSKKAELRALYIITLNNSDSAKLLSKLDPSHFLFPATSTAFRRYLHILRTKSEHMDWHSLCDDPALEESHREMLSGFNISKMGTYNVDSTFSVLDRYRAGRALNAIADGIRDRLKTKFDPDEEFDRVAEALSSARTTSEDQVLYHIGKGNNTTDLFLDAIDQSKEVPIKKSGFKTYDDEVGGLPEEGVMIIAATTSSGKSTVANQLAINMNNAGWDVCKVSLEMPAEQEMLRFVSNQARIDMSRLFRRKLTKDEIKKARESYKNFVNAAKREEKRFTIISPTEDLTFTQILMLVKVYEYDVIIIDYISLLKEDTTVDQWKHLSDVAREAKRYSMKTKTLVILLAQLDEKENEIRYSKAIKEHADVVWTWHVNDSDRDNGTFMIHQTKGRNQGLISWEVKSEFKHMRITDDGGGGYDNDDSEISSDEDTNISDLMG